VVRHGLG
jgi:hypothetical protein